MQLSNSDKIVPELTKNPSNLAIYFQNDILGDPAAVVKNFYEKGRVVLSTCHPEISKEFLSSVRRKPGYSKYFWPYDTADAFDKEFLPLQESEGFRESLLKTMFTEVGIIPRESEVTLDEEKCPA